MSLGQVWLQGRHQICLSSRVMPPRGWPAMFCEAHFELAVVRHQPFCLCLGQFFRSKESLQWLDLVMMSQTQLSTPERVLWVFFFVPVSGFSGQRLVQSMHVNREILLYVWTYFPKCLFTPWPVSDSGQKMGWSSWVPVCPVTLCCSLERARSLVFFFFFLMVPRPGCEPGIFWFSFIFSL